MWNRMYGPYRQNAVWVYNQEIEPQLLSLSQPGRDATGADVTTWGTFMFVPPGAMSAGPYGTLMGRPMIPSQACSALSTEGDIIFAAFDQYLALLKSGPNPRLDISMHLWFDQDISCFKFVLRIGGIPWLSAPIQPLNGTNTYSAFITLQTR
jgi:Phage capsid family.